PAAFGACAVVTYPHAFGLPGKTTRAGPRKVSPRACSRLSEALLGTLGVDVHEQVQAPELELAGRGRPRCLLHAVDDDRLGLLAEGAGDAVRVRTGGVKRGRVLTDVDVGERGVTVQLGHVDQEVGGVRLATGGTRVDHQADRQAGDLDRLAQVGQLRVRHAGRGNRHIGGPAVSTLRVDDAAVLHEAGGLELVGRHLERLARDVERRGDGTVGNAEDDRATT